MEVDIRGLSLEMPIRISKVSSAAFLIWMELSVLVAGQSAPNGKPQPSPQMGVSTGAAHAPVKDAQSRPGESDHLFHNNGDGTFTDVSVRAGVSDPKGYYGFASVFVDVNDDGWLDLAVANDSNPKYLYRNRRDGTFEDVSYMSGFGLTEDGREQASMGIAVGDYDRDGIRRSFQRRPPRRGYQQS